MSELDDLIEVMHRLRSDCAWNRLQTHESLAQYLIEEAHESADAIEAGTADDLVEELGDVLYQVLFHAEIAVQDGEGWDIQTVAARVRDKMVRRHPHVFAGVVAETPEDVVRVWTAVKAEEKAARTSVLDGVPPALPALMLADKLIGRAQSVGLLDEGIGPIPVTTEAELGPLLLAIVASARAGGLDAERALRSTLRELQAEIRDAESGG